VIGLPTRALVRYHRDRPWLFLLSVLGVALGVSVIVAMALAIESARLAFARSTEAVAGRTTHQVVPRSGPMDETVFRRVRVDARVRLSAPLVEGEVEAPALPGRVLTLVGVDPLSESGIRSFLERAAAGAGALTSAGRAVFSSAALAEEAGWGVGDSLTLVSREGPAAFVLAGMFGAGDEGGASGLLVADISVAQPFLGLVGVLSRIDLRLPDGEEGERAAERVRAVLPPDAQLTEAGVRATQVQQLTRAFELNLTALSLLSLVFGTFLIYNTITFSVVQRRETVGTLRALGAGRRQLAGAIVGEGLLIGLAGGLIGLGVGVVLGRGLVGLVTRTINDLYYTVSVRSVELSPRVLVGALILGVAAAGLAASLPAFEATRGAARSTLLRSALEEHSRVWVRRLLWVASVLLGAAWLVVAALPETVPWGFVALTLILLAMAAAAPAAVTALSAALAAPAGWIAGTLGRSAVRSIGRALSRTGPAIAALVVSIAVTVGMGGMISSFRTAVADWLGQTLQADVYVSPPGSGSVGPQGVLDTEFVERVRALPEVGQVSRYRGLDLSADVGLVRMVALDLAEAGESAFRFEEGEAAAALSAFRLEDAALVSEPFRYRTGLGVDSVVVLPTPAGERPFRIAGVFTDYGTERGTLMISRAAYDRYWDDPATSSLGLFAAPGVSTAAVITAARSAAGERAVVLQSNGELRERSLVVFDRTFAVTSALRLLAFAVAFIGIVGALMALELERVREFGLLRASGLTPAGLRALIVGETTFLGLACGVVAVPAGWALAYLMVHVINRRSFGWGMDLTLGWELAAQALVLGVVGALLASLYPAWRISRTSPAIALRTE